MSTVTAIRRPSEGYLETLLADQPLLPASVLPCINNLRADAVDCLGALTMPTKRDEAWKFTNISPLTKLFFEPMRIAISLQPADVEHFYIEEATTRVVFVDGVYAPNLSSFTTDVSVVVDNLPAVVAAQAATIEAHLGRYMAFHDNVFAALNTAFLQDAALIMVARNVALAAPVHLLFVATQTALASYPRCLVVAESGSNLTLIEDYVALQDDSYFINPVTEIALADNAHVNHIRVQRDSGKAFHISNCGVSLGRSSNYQSVSIALGAQISRYNLNVLMDEGAECAVDGLALIKDSQLADTHTCIDHAQPHGVSRQLHKCIVGGKAHAVFNGNIRVRQGAQSTDSVQSNGNLLLTDKARVDAKPQLEIFADDVKCAHGATIGQLDSEEVFYLKSRGLSDSVARNLLTYAFGAEVIDRIPVASLKHRLEQKVLEQTSRQP
ncbi:MAG: Fe-S cluster assembly protein SufD [Candidatus Azotimanducaceae bacterium]|jgi:Fe-S cluster assembly protein SufD